MPLAEFQQKFRAALEDAGYDTREKIVKLVREVRGEKAREAGRRPQSDPAEATS